MTDNQKTQKTNSVLNNIALHYEEFLKQAEKKIDTRYAQRSEAPEIVSDVTYRIIKKLNNHSHLIRFYTLTKEGKLFNYIVKSIDTNCKSLNAPFLREKLKQRNRITINEEIYDHIAEEPSPEESYLFLETRYIKIGLMLKSMNTNWDNITIDERISLCDYTIKVFNHPKKAMKVFGTHWKYFKTLFEEYTNTLDTSWNKLSDKYNIPTNSLYNDFRRIKKMLQDEIDTFYN